jgi:hypothetical protein
MLDAAGRELLPSIPAKLDQILGVFSLCEISDNLLMWAHYGASHSGFVLELDPNHEYFNARRTEKDEFGHLRQVRYRDVRPSASLTGLDGVDLFLVKSREWEYEREWRILRPLREADKVINAEAGDVHLFKLPSGCVKAIILGVRASDALESAARHSVSRGGALEQSKLLRCVPDESTFALRVVEVAA